MRRSTIESMLAEKWNEQRVTQGRRAHAVRRAFDQRQRLLAALPYGNQEASARGKLLDQRRRHARPPRGHEDGVVGRIARPSQCAIPQEHRDVAGLRFPQRALRALREGLDPLHREHLSHEPRQEGGLVPRAGADLEHALTTLQVQRLEVPGLREWLGDGLALPDRQRAVLVRPVPYGGGNEEMARRLGEGAQYGEVLDPLLAQLLHETGAVAAERVGAGAA